MIQYDWDGRSKTIDISFLFVLQSILNSETDYTIFKAIATHETHFQ